MIYLVGINRDCIYEYNGYVQSIEKAFNTHNGAVSWLLKNGYEEPSISDNNVFSFVGDHDESSAYITWSAEIIEMELDEA